jgi:hypothetical protein
MKFIKSNITRSNLSILLIVAAILLMIFPSSACQYDRHREDEPNSIDSSSASSIKKVAKDGKPRGGPVLVLSSVAPENSALRPLEAANLQKFSASDKSIYEGDRLLLNWGGQRISSVQESPDSSAVVLFNNSTSAYEVYRYKNKQLQLLDIELPHSDHTKRVNSWYWLGNNRLIGEHFEMLEPAPRGFSDEGWVKNSKIYIFDLEARLQHEVKLPTITRHEEEQIKTLKDDLDPEYSYEIPIYRYYKIKGITSSGSAFLTSLDTSKPNGGDERDEGWFLPDEE